ncbi:hypothetical protein ACFE04_021301 [Oxalis oulophora]
MEVWDGGGVGVISAARFVWASGGVGVVALLFFDVVVVRPRGLLGFVATSFPAVIGFHHQSWCQKRLQARFIARRRLAPAQPNSASLQFGILGSRHGYDIPPVGHFWFRRPLISAGPGAVGSGFIGLGLVSTRGKFSASTTCFAHIHDVEADLGVPRHRYQVVIVTTSSILRHLIVFVFVRGLNIPLTSRHRVDSLSSSRHPLCLMPRHPPRYHDVIPTSLLPRHLCITASISTKK